MRRLTDAALLAAFMRRLGEQRAARGRVYLTGGARAVLLGWRPTTVDVDMKLDPEAEAVLEAVPRLKEELQINVELASPDDFIPELPGWRDRSSSAGKARWISSTTTCTCRRLPRWSGPM